MPARASWVRSWMQSCSSQKKICEYSTVIFRFGLPASASNALALSMLVPNTHASGNAPSIIGGTMDLAWLPRPSNTDLFSAS